MKSNFSACLAEVLKWEGGYSNHPADPGGATNFGVIQVRYDEYRKDNNLPKRPVKQITKAEVNAIYRRYYWDVVKGDQLPSGVDLAVFDFGVNSGPSRSIKYLQAVLGLDQDGVLGPVTLKAVLEAPQKTVINTLLDNRMSFLKRLGIWSTFGRGWTRRVKGVRAKALSMISRQTPTTQPTATDNPTNLFELILTKIFALIQRVFS